MALLHHYTSLVKPSPHPISFRHRQGTAKRPKLGHNFLRTPNRSSPCLALSPQFTSSSWKAQEMHGLLPLHAPLNTHLQLSWLTYKALLLSDRYLAPQPLSLTMGRMLQHNRAVLCQHRSKPVHSSPCMPKMNQ